MSKYFVIAALVLSWLMGMLTCNTFRKEKECPPCIEPLEGGRIVDSDTTIRVKKDSAKSHKVEPVRITLPTMATGRAPAVIFKPMPVYMPADTGAIIAQYKALYEDCGTLKEYDQRFPFGGDTVHLKQSIQGNDLWEQSVYLTHTDRTITNVVREKQRNTLWVGVNGGYQPQDSLFYVGPSLMFVHKKGMAFEGEVKINNQGSKLYEGSVKFQLGKK